MRLNLIKRLLFGPQERKRIRDLSLARRRRQISKPEITVFVVVVIVVVVVSPFGRKRSEPDPNHR